MDDNIEIFDGPTTLDIPPSRVLSGAQEQSFKSIVVLGELEDGSLYFASSAGDGAAVLWLIEKAKKDLLDF